MKCPKGTPSQVQANLEYLQNLAIGSCAGSYEVRSDGFRVCKTYESNDDYEGEAEMEYPMPMLDLDDVRADKRHPPTTEDEIVYLFINHFMDVLLKSWDGTPCLRPKLNRPVQSEESKSSRDGISEAKTFDKVSLYNVSSDYINGLYKTRSQKLSKDGIGGATEGRLSAICRKYCESRRSAQSISTESEGYGEDDRTDINTSESDSHWKMVIPDEEVQMSFQNGIRYNGRVSRRLMDGDGTFFWDDGGSYKGEFIGGNATGYGRLEYPNLSVYEGNVFNAFRHGEGLMCMRFSPVMYSGEWWLGKKNGTGLLIYSDPMISLDFYRGNFLNGKKEGFGYRQYPSGSRYIGFWQNGKRHGTGVMFWCNHDIYRGEWKDGVMDGFGEYTWNGFVNKTFSYPKTNVFRGFWANGKRKGCGSLEMSNGAFVETLWKENEKYGPGAVICPNGMAIAAERLFMRDKPALLNVDEEDTTGLFLRSYSTSTGKKKKKVPGMPHEAQMIAFVSSVEKAKAISIPVHTPVHSLDLSPHVRRLQDQRKEFCIRQNAQMEAFKNTPRIESIHEVKPCIYEVQPSAEFYTREEKLLRYAIMINLSKLKRYYDEWSTVACSEPPPFECILMRLVFWEMLTEADVPQRHMSLVDIDKILDQEELFFVDAPHDPFERIQFWQFIQFLITISWYLYGRYVYGENIQHENSRIEVFLEAFYQQMEKNVLGSAFNYFLENHIFELDLENTSAREVFMKKDLVPLGGMYLLYKRIGEPHSAKQFLSKVYGKPNESTFINPIYYQKLPRTKIEGKNAITFTTELSYLTTHDPFNEPELYPLEREPPDEITGLGVFAELGARGIVKCLVQVCPLIVEDDVIVDIEYQLTFLEFYKTVLLCAEHLLRKKALKEMKSEIMMEFKSKLEEYQQKLKEYEKQKETNLTLAKKGSHTKKNKK